MSAVRSSRPRKTDPLAKKVPENPKYKHVKATVDTGASVTKYIQRVEEIKKNYRFQKDEIFKRMKISTYVQLLIQVAGLSNITESPREEDAGEDTARPDTADLEVRQIQDSSSELFLGDGDTGRETSRSTLQEVIRGVGEIDVYNPKPNITTSIEEEICVSSPYLLLDIREKDDYNQCHMITALNYPTAMLSRSVNYETKDLLAYKNKPGKIILIYDCDEKLAPKAATTFVQRGYDNLFMLSGGMKVAFKGFPTSLFTGTLPEDALDKKRKTTEPVVPANQEKFMEHDIDQLSIYLDNILIDSSIGSRMSKPASANSRVGSKMSQRSDLSTAGSVQGRPAFR